jgi:hypothetical protein
MPTCKSRKRDDNFALWITPQAVLKKAFAVTNPVRTTFVFEGKVCEAAKSSYSYLRAVAAERGRLSSRTNLPV